MNTNRVLACLSFAMWTLGCAANADLDGAGSDEEVGEVALAAGSWNGLGAEVVRSAALNNEPFYRDELLGHPLSGAALAPALKDLLSSDPSSHTLMVYVVRCALDGDARVSFEQGGVAREYHGEVGLAARWGEGACDQVCRGWVSACVLAHVNYNHESMPINLVAAPLMPDTGYADYPHEEATYWGDVFAADEDQKRNACINDATRLQRVCGPDTVTCGGFLRGSGAAHALSPCETTCRDELTDGGQQHSTYYTGCSVLGETSDATLTVWRKD